MTAAPPKSDRALPRLPLIGVLFAGCTGLFVAGYFLVLRQDYVVLYEDLRASDASAIIEELESRRISYQLREGGEQILVPSSHVDAVRLAIAGEGISSRNLDGFELFDNSDLGLTDFAQRIKFQRALQGELARTIMMTQGVLEARVHISIPDKSLFRGEQKPAKAAVTLVTRSAEFETHELVDGVRQLMAAAISELAVDDVVVLNARGEVISPAAPPSANLEHLRAVGDAQSVSADVTPMILGVLHQVLPDEQLSISVESEGDQDGEQPGSAAEADDEFAATLARRKLRITSPSPLSATQRSNVINALRGAGVFPDTHLEDVLIFDSRGDPQAASDELQRPAPLPVQIASEAPRTFPDRPPSAPDLSQISPSQLIWAGLAALSFLGIAGALAVTLARRSTSLSAEDQQRFADQLRLGLQDNSERADDDFVKS